MKHLMVDLETMGNGSQAAIIGIGACFFDPVTGQIGETFSRNVTLQSSVDEGLKMDVSTVEWWLKQDDDARAIFQRSGYPLPEVLQEFLDFIPERLRRSVQLWGNGASFDNVILENAFDVCGLKAPWAFWNHRDVRTIVELGRTILGIDPKRDFFFDGVKHDALSDAVHQARYVSAIWGELQGAVDLARTVEGGKAEKELALHFRE
ncbi:MULTISPECIES: 3'-5' exonuclease [unclassified Endozoicomonas]|uniref:3'-5' exonuclease n=1 Tax=unclassified Endozoicomonas TaxID=2644528 RepID=UPI0021484374|nr:MULTISPECIES: 3'-5' exonuclease [unclassified Endozoicomonas]